MGCEEVSLTTLIYLTCYDVSAEDVQLKHLLFHFNLVIKMKINAPQQLQSSDAMVNKKDKTANAIGIKNIKVELN